MNALSTILTRTRVEGLVIFLVAVGYLWEAGNVPAFYQLPGVPGPTTFPWVLGVVFALSGLWLAVSPLDIIAARRKRGEAAVEPAPEAPVRPEAGGLLAGLAGGWHFYSMWAVILLYLCSMPTLGFPAATFVLLAVFFTLLGERRRALVIGLALATTAVIYVVFSMGLNVRLPLGVLEPLVRR